VETGIFSPKHLLTEADLVAFAREGGVKLILTPTAIITPAAKDFAQAKGIHLQRGRQADEIFLPGKNLPNSVAVLAARSSATEKRAVFDAIAARDFTPIEIPVPRTTTSALNLALNQMAKQIRAGIFCSGVVIDENAFSLSIQANKLDDIRAVVCWDVSSAAASQQESRANLLFLNNRLLGLRSLKEITEVWLTNLKNVE
jgi:ribose 5-phosphate isomerase RpiB